MKKIFIYWDNSNIFHGCQYLTEELDLSPNARQRVRLHFKNLFELACADRKIERSFVAGSIPPEVRHLWNHLENMGITVKLYDRGGYERGEQNMPDTWLQLQMLEDTILYNGDPGIACLLTGDGAGYTLGYGFHHILELMLGKGWQIEVLAWREICNRRMREWAEKNGLFVALDDFYSSITYTERSLPGEELAQSRTALPIDLSRRSISKN